jgi:hypothetical protein
MADETNESVAYLKALKQSDVPVTASAGAAAPAREPRLQPDLKDLTLDMNERFQGMEKRRSPRQKCEGSAELRENDCDVRTWASFQDVSLHGCYVEAQATYPVGTLLRMKLEANGVRVEAGGEVRVNYPYLGMGIAFQEMSEENRAQLRKLLSTLSHSTVVMGPRVASSLSSGDGAEAVSRIADPAATVRALMEFFENRQMLMRDDFLKILRTSQAAKNKL